MFERAEVYRNLNRRCVSVRVAGRVVAHATAVVVRDVEFRVQRGTVARVRRTGRRAVCAYARGAAEVVPGAAPFLADAVRVHFNPHRGDEFTLDDGTPVRRARLLVMDSPTGAWVVGPETP
jgi:hypothetical protein